MQLSSCVQCQPPGCRAVRVSKHQLLLAPQATAAAPRPLHGLTPCSPSQRRMWRGRRAGQPKSRLLPQALHSHLAGILHTLTSRQGRQPAQQLVSPPGARRRRPRCGRRPQRAGHLHVNNSASCRAERLTWVGGLLRVGGRLFGHPRASAQRPVPLLRPVAAMGPAEAPAIAVRCPARRPGHAAGRREAAAPPCGRRRLPPAAAAQRACLAPAPPSACSVIYLLFCLAAVASKLTTGFRLYLLLALSCACACRPPPRAATPPPPPRAYVPRPAARRRPRQPARAHPLRCKPSWTASPGAPTRAVRGVAWALRATDISQPGAVQPGLEATSLALRQAGFGISLAVQAILMGCWCAPAWHACAVRSMRGLAAGRAAGRAGRTGCEQADARARWAVRLRCGRAVLAAPDSLASPPHQTVLCLFARATPVQVQERRRRRAAAAADALERGRAAADRPHCEQRCWAGSWGGGSSTSGAGRPVCPPQCRKLSAGRLLPCLPPVPTRQIVFGPICGIAIAGKQKSTPWEGRRGTLREGRGSAGGR